MSLVLAVLLLAFFHEVTLEGKTFVSPDTTQPAGFVRVGERALYHDHVYPLWNPYVFLGMPSFGSGAYNPLIYPPDWPVALVQKALPFLPDMTWMLIYYFLAGLFLYLLARDWGARPEGALLGAVVFVYAPNLVAVGSHGHGSQLVDSAYVPLMVWLASRWLNRGGLHHLAWLALAGGFQLLRGHVQICFYTWLAIALYALVVWIATAVKRREQLAGMTARTVAVAGAAALAFGLAGFYNMPLRDYAQWSIRGSEPNGGVALDYATSWSMAPWELPSILVSWWAGFGNATYWGAMPFTDYPNYYVGLVAAALAVPAFFANGPARVFALLAAVVAVLIGLGKFGPVYHFLYLHAPLFNKFRIPVMIVILFELAAALAVAWGWSAILAAGDEAPRARRVSRAIAVTAGVVAVALVAGLFGQQGFQRAYMTSAVQHRLAVTSLTTHMYDATAAAEAYRRFVPDLARACVLALLALGIAWLARRRRLPAVVATAGVLGLLLFDLWHVSASVMGPAVGPAVARNLDVGRDDVVDFLEKAGPPGSFRVFSLDPQEFQSNRYAGFGIATLGGYQAAKPKLFQHLLDKTHGGNLVWHRVLNIRYIVAPQAFERTPPFLKLVYQGPSGIVYQNLDALPRAMVFGQYRVAQPNEAILDSIDVRGDSLGMAEVGQLVFLDHDPHLKLGPVAGATATITHYGLNDVSIDVNTPGDGVLQLADAWYPDWVATVDGRPTEVLRSDYLLRAVAVPAGRHQVVFRFQSRAVRQGLMMTLGSLLVILALFAAAWLRRPRPQAPAAPAREAA